MYSKTDNIKLFNSLNVYVGVKIPIPLMILKLYWDKNIIAFMVVVICAMNAEVVTSFVGMCVL